MNIRIARLIVASYKRVLPLIKLAQNRAQIRVASRWLEANTKLEYDIMLRLQVLEGAAGVPLGTWWTKRTQGLRLAQGHFENQGEQPDPTWFDFASSGMSNIAEGVLGRVISRFPVISGTEPLDVINAALMGIPLDPTEQIERLRPAYESGRYLRSKILSGEETPQEVAKGILARLLVRRVQDLAKNIRLERQTAVDDDGAPVDIPSPVQEKPAFQVFSQMLFQGTDSLSLKLRALLRKTWAPSRPMTLWLDHVLTTGEYPKNSDIVETVARESPRGTFTAQTFSQRHFRPYWEKFLKAVFSNPTLKAEISDAFESMGATGDLPETFEGLPTGRLASQYLWTSNFIRHLWG